ncbi:ImmA/IrrE family metallo-endopeptidase [Virgibacillus sp. W0181]|uniref:ImmA/IrrE family metallo-endopeptidase n=1 Tax=Virgibacillus sp. W0181 TaxID=3391581 RepID=UPI003F47F368
MGIEHSFNNYVEVKFYNELFDALQDFISNHSDKLDIRLSIVEEIDEIELSDIVIKKVYVEDLPGSIIAFDVLIEAYIEVSDTNKRIVDEREIGEQWFILECLTNMESNFQQFKIKQIEVYNQSRNRSKVNNKLSEYFVPIIKKEEFEKVAENFLKEYYPESLITPTPIDPILLATKMNLKVFSRTITKDGSVFGQIYFKDTNTLFYDESTESYIQEYMESGSIVVDPNCYFLRNLGSYNNTIVHECVHWHLHKKAFILKSLFDEEITKINCKVSGGVKGNEKDYIDWMEWQANSLAPKILMPLNMFKQEAYLVIQDLMKENKTNDLLAIIEETIDKLAEFFGVSRLAAKIRMIDAGYDEAMGAFNFIDGRYIPTHSFKKGTLERNQTFSIGAVDAGILSFTDADFARLTSSGRYVYIDSHFVLNTPKYVEKDLFGNLTLTNYARHNMNECCLVFTITVRSSDRIGANYHSECVLNRDENSPFEFDISFHQGYENSTPEKQELFLEKVIMENMEMYGKMSNDFCDCLAKVKDWRGLTYKEIAAKIPMDDRQVRRIFNGESNGSLETLVAICIALYLPPEISFHIIDQSAHRLSTRVTSHQWYRYVLMYFQGKSVDETRDFLKKYDVTL